MQRIILTYGLVSGGIIILSVVLSLSLESISAESVSTLEWLGYLFMIVALSMIFVGIKRYRDNDLGGVIRFSTGLLLGLGITVVASIVYVIVWEVNLSLTDYAFIEDYTNSVIQAKEAEGVSGEALEQVKSEMDSMRTQYANPLYRVPMTFLEIFPVGVIISLISAVTLRKSTVLPASA